MGQYSINWKFVPKEFEAFKRWHKRRLASDTLTAEERFLKEGGIIPKEVPNVSKPSKRVKKKDK